MDVVSVDMQPYMDALVSERRGKETWRDLCTTVNFVLSDIKTTKEWISFPRQNNFSTVMSLANSRYHKDGFTCKEKSDICR